MQQIYSQFTKIVNLKKLRHYMALMGLSKHNREGVGVGDGHLTEEHEMQCPMWLDHRPSIS